MPMYEYKCDRCGESFERYSAGKSAESEVLSCVKCGKGPVKKVFSTFASTCCGSSGSVSSTPAGCGGGKSPFS